MEQKEIGWWKKEFVEKGAELEHIRWAKWQNYLHTFLTWNNELQAWVLPHEKKDRWQMQINTPYSMLSEQEKESDRKEAREYLRLVENIELSARKDERERAKDMILDVIQETDWIEEPKSAFGRLNEALKGLDNNK